MDVLFGTLLVGFLLFNGLIGLGAGAFGVFLLGAIVIALVG